MKNIFLSLLFILTVSFAFANDIKKDDDNKGKKQVETKRTTKAIKQKTQSAKPDAVFTCAKEVKTTKGETVLVVTSAWGLTGPAAMKNCIKKLNTIFVY